MKSHSYSEDKTFNQELIPIICFIIHPNDEYVHSCMFYNVQDGRYLRHPWVFKDLYSEIHDFWLHVALEVVKFIQEKYNIDCYLESFEAAIQYQEGEYSQNYRILIEKDKFNRLRYIVDEVVQYFKLNEAYFDVNKFKNQQYFNLFFSKVSQRIMEKQESTEFERQILIELKNKIIDLKPNITDVKVAKMHEEYLSILDSVEYLRQNNKDYIEKKLDNHSQEIFRNQFDIKDQQELINQLIQRVEKLELSTYKNG